MYLQPEDINTILVNELGKLGADASMVGGSLGAGFVAKQLPAESYQEIIEPSLTNVEIINLLRQYFDNQDPQSLEIKGSNALVFKKLTGSGFMNMNPTLLIAIAQETTVYAVAYAKEGMIKQHSAQKAVKAFANTLQF